MANFLRTIKLKRGVKANLPTLNIGEPALVTDENELYIGTDAGNVKLTSKSEISNIVTINVENFPLIAPETDDTSRVQRAIASLGSNKGIVLFPKPTYSISNTITIPNDNIILKGNGWSTNIILTGGRTLFYALEKGGIQVRDMYIADGSTSRSEWTLHFKNCRNIKIDNVLLTSGDMTTADTAGIYFEKDTAYTNSFTNRVSNCQLRQSSIKIESSDSYVLYSEIWGQKRSYAIQLVKSEQFIIGCQIVPSDVYGGVYIKDTKDNWDVENIKISDTYFDGSYYSVSTGIGIYAEKLRFSSIIGCDFWHLKEKGIYFKGICFANTVTANKFNCCDSLDIGFEDILADNIDGSVFANNIFNRDSNFDGGGVWATRTRTNKVKATKTTVNGSVGNKVQGNTIWTPTNYLTSDIKTNVETYFNTSAAATVGSETQVVFDTENVDTLNEFSSGTFTATRTGQYLISSYVSFGAIPTNTRMMINVRKNNVNKVRLSDITYSGGASGNATLGGSCQLNLSAGDSIKIYYYTSQACNLAGGELYTNLRITELTQ